MKTVWAKSRCTSAAILSLALAAGTTLATGSSVVLAAQEAAATPTTLTLAGVGATPISLSVSDLAAMPRTTAPLASDGNTNMYEGVLLYDILAKSGVQFGRGTKGNGMASYVLVTAKDGYQVLFSLSELDPQFGGEKVIVADKMDGGPLPGPQQPFRVVSPGDKAHARSLYSVVKIEVVRLK